MEPQEKPKFHWKRLLITVGIVIVTAGVIGGSIWYVMDKQAKKDEIAAEKRIQDLRQQIDDLENQQKIINDAKKVTETITPIKTQEEAIRQAEEYEPPAGVGCAAVIVPAVHKATGAKYTFPDSCLAPGWESEPQE